MNTPAATLTVHFVLAGAFASRGRVRGRAILPKVMHSHASIDGARTALCGKVKEDALCEELADGPATCPTCAKRAAKLAG